MPGRAVFLDRDGVINAAVVRDGLPYPPAGLAELHILPGVELALLRLKAAGFTTIVVTNQPDVARGTRTRAAVEEINRWLAGRLALDDFRVCYHDNSDHCNCRKPAPGLLQAAAQDFGLDLAASYMVGDRWRDIEAGQRAGCGTILIDYHYAESHPIHPDIVVSSLAEAVDWILDRALRKGEYAKN